MGEAAAAPQLSITVQETEDAKSNEHTVARRIKYKLWPRIALYTFFVLSGQAVCTLLGRLYYDKGGKSKWMATLVQLVGFPILIPFYFLSPLKDPPTNTTSVDTKPPPSLIKLASVYVSLGLLLAVDCFLYSVGLLYLPVSTYSLICASQLGFNALFSYFLNSQKFTPFIVNSLLLLTMSSTLLVSHNDNENPTKGVSKGNYLIGFICTVGASAGYGLVLSLTQLAFRKVIKRHTFGAVMDMIIYQSLVATSVIVVGLFASGEWNNLHGEMENYEQGKMSYLMNLVWTAIFWQVFAIGAVGLIFEVSSLFSNVISVLGLPIVPVLAVIFFGDKMDGVKVIAMILAIWGFISYIYQHYLDDSESKTQNKNAIELHSPSSS